MSEICDDCGEEMERPFDNGDGKIRCEKCSVEKYERDCGPLVLFNCKYVIKADCETN